MAEAHKNQSDTTPSGAERRAFHRYPVHLYATVKKKDMGCKPCTVRSFCVGGMHLAFDREIISDNGLYKYTPALGDIVEVNCQLPAEFHHKPLQFSGKIVRAGVEGAGLSFIQPDVNDLLLLQKLAVENRQLNRQRITGAAVTNVPEVLASATRLLAESVAQSKKPRAKIIKTDTQPPAVPANDPFVVAPTVKESEANTASHAQLITRCNAIFERHVLRLINIFFKVVDHHLFSVARDEINAFDQKLYFDAKEEIEAAQESIRNNFCQSVAEFLATYNPDQPIHPALNYDDLNGQALTLSLMEDEDFDEWLADTVAIDNIETHYRQTLVDLDKRLSVIWDVEIHKENNVYGPYLLSHTFQQTIKKTKLIHQAKVVCYKQFENVLLNNLDSLFDELNELLIKNNILPVIRYEIKVDKKQQRKPEVELQEAHDQAVSLLSTLGGSIGASQGQDNSAELTQANNSDDAVAGTNRQEVQKGDKNNIKDLYQLVGDLKNLQLELQQQLKDGANHAASGQMQAADYTSVTQSSDKLVKECSAEELLDAISKIQPAIDQPIAIDEHPDEFKARLVAAIDETSPNGESVIGRREEQIIDVASNIFHSVLTDKQVAESVRSWIKRLEIPVLKIAIVDDALFIDRKHFVRQVINKIAELEILTKEGDETQKAIVNRAIDWLVNLINTEFDQSSDVFRRAGQQLDLLIDVQNKSFADNLKHVVNVSKLEEQQLALTHKPEQEIALESVDDEQWLQWKKKVERLHDGAWLVFEVKKDKPIRLRLAWVAPHTKRYIFVNVLGKKDRVLPLAELTSLLKDGDAIVLDNANEPALDRAQYAMLQELHEKLLHQTTHDQLTGLINRREFDRRLEKLLTKVHCTDSRHALLFLDVDRFNVFNNTCGYQGADQLLIELTALINNTIQQDCEIARLGSDEFGILLFDSSIEDSLDISEQVIQEISEYKFIWNEQAYAVSASLGLVPVNRAWEDTSALLQAAESSCGIAKEVGGNRMQLYHAGHSKLRQRSKMMNWVTEIESALGRNAFQLKGQKISPIRDTESSKGHYEILLTVQDQEGNELSIGEFIEAAEWYNRITEIDRWVITHTLNWMADNTTVLDDIDTFSINLSGRSMNDASLIDFVEEQIRDTGVPAEKICFEITETAGISNLSDAAEFIASVKEFGCRFSLDDFGSGMSSYAYLKNLAIDYIKIDGAFIKDIENNSSDYAVVKSICEIGHFMGKKIIAECVEQEATLNSLKDLGVDYAQGFYIEKPKPLSEL